MTELVEQDERVIDGETGEIIEQKQDAPMATMTTFYPQPAMTVDQLVQAVEMRQEVLHKVLAKIEGGLIDLPGEKKKGLGKPGAEQLLNLYGMQSEPYEAHEPVLDYDGTGPGHGEPLLRFSRGCRIYKQTGPRVDDRYLVAAAESVCLSRESKYRYRKQERKCPECGEEKILRSKHKDRDHPNDPPGWYCYRKIGGCGLNFMHDDERITSQEVGTKLNPEIADSENTILQIASKRALVSATRLATGFSDLLAEESPGREEGDAPQGRRQSDGQPASEPEKSQEERDHDEMRHLKGRITAWLTIPEDADDLKTQHIQMDQEWAKQRAEGFGHEKINDCTLEELREILGGIEERNEGGRE